MTTTAITPRSATDSHHTANTSRSARAIGVWNEIDAVTVSVFAEDCLDAYFALAAATPALTAFTPFAAESSLSIPALPARTGVPFDASTMSLTREAVGVIPTTELQRCAAEVLDVRHTLNLMIDVFMSMAPLDTDELRLAKSTLILDLCNLYDLIFGIAAGRDPGQAPFLELLEDAVDASTFGDAAAALRARASLIDQHELRNVREARNKACAHVDSQMRFADVVALIDGVTTSSFDALYGFALDSFGEACQKETLLKVFLLTDTTLEGAIGVEKTDAVKSFDP